VVPSYNVDHGDTSRTLDFQILDIEDNARRSTCLWPILKEEAEAMAINNEEVVKDSPNQVCP
jgi:hypothetical protein